MTDVVITGGKIVDGTGNPWKYGDVLVRDDRIAEITPPGRIDRASVDDVIDATGMVVCPGFIDIQSHSIAPLMEDGRCLSKITQGITTEIMGEGWTPAPFGGLIDDPLPKGLTTIPDEWRERARGWKRFHQWLGAYVERGVSPNVGSFLGGGTLRSYAKGMAMGEASEDELTTMRHVMAEAMDDGAFGVSFALIYPPDSYMGTDEIVEICKVVAEHNGVYITHMRSEADQFLEALEETIEISRRSGVAVEIYHHKAAGIANWPKMPQAIERIDQARAEGLDVTSDMYPYVAAGTGLSSCLPPWAQADGKLLDNLRDPEMREKIRKETLNPGGDWEPLMQQSGTDGVMPVSFNKPENQQYVGKRLSEIAEMRGQEPVDAIMDLLLSEEHRISTIYFCMNEDNVKLQLQQPWIKISTDAGGVDPEWAADRGPTHPRAYGTYPRVLGKYVRDENVLTLEDAVRKMTSSVATRLGIRDRGELRSGMFADIVIFDPETISDRATFDDPHQLSVGVRDVLVNGDQVVRNGEHTGALPGTVVTGKGG
ncbi:MAG: N-acyl-D-amino-acid deacylase family protein [Chloroflexota bacterium]